MSPAQISSARPAPRLRGRPTTSRRSPYGVPASLVLHGLGVAAMVFAFQNNLGPPDTHVVPVELVIAEQTNIAAAAPPAPPEETFERPPLEALSAPPVPDIAEPAPVEAKAPEFKVAPPPREERNNISDLLNQLTKPDRTAPRTAPRASDAVGASNMATASLADALRAKIRACWNPIPGAPNPADQIVTFDMRLNRDGTIASWALVSAPNGGSFTQSAVEAASRAAYACQAYDMLPADRYNEWREFRLRFDPRQMQ